METIKSFINAVNADIANSNVNYSSLCKIAEVQDITGTIKSKTYVAIVYLSERADSEPVFRIYYNFDSTMGNKVNYTIRKTIKEAEEEFANTL